MCPNEIVWVVSATTSELIRATHSPSLEWWIKCLIVTPSDLVAAK